jgi:hypothetical protein
MDKKILLKKLNLYYYLIFVKAVLVAVTGYFMAKYDITIDTKTNLGIGIGSFSMLFLLFSLPLILKQFSKKTKEIAQLADVEEKQQQYIRWSMIRLFIVGFNFIINVLFYYLLQPVNNSFLFAAVIGAIVLYFCKPSQTKITLDIFPDELEETEKDEKQKND